MEQLKPGNVIANDYEIIAQLSQGSFGKVYLGKSLSLKQNVAIKVEKQEMMNYMSLFKEIEILGILEGVPQIPKVFWSGQENGMNIMVQNLLGKDLIHYQRKIKKFTFDCIFNIASQMIDILEQIHKRNVIHRDLKPENILGASQSDKIYLIDFGIAKFLEDHKKSKEKVSFIGTQRYASIAAHLGIEQTKKDDLESLGYVLIYFMNHTLPWMSVQKDDKERIDIIGQLKSDITPEELCVDLPKSILKYMKYVRSLNKRSKPNYAQLKDLFKIDLPNRMPFDWNHRPKSFVKSNKSIKSVSQKRYSKSKSQLKNMKQQSQKFIDASSPLLPPKKTIKTYVQLDNADKTIFNTSDENQNSIGENKQDQESIKVGYSVSYEPSKFSKYSQHKKSPLNQQQRDRARVSTLDANPYDLIIMPQKVEQQLQEFENQDLETKYNKLLWNSIYFNYKNPIVDFKVIHYNVD